MVVAAAALLCFAAADACAGVGAEDHPWLGRQFAADQLGGVMLQAEADARASPACKPRTRWSVLFLVQAPTSSTGGLGPDGWYRRVLRQRRRGRELLAVTFKLRSPDALFFPKSTLAEGRNLLWAAAVKLEVARGYRFSYLVWMDDDVTWAGHEHSAGVDAYEKFLRYWRPVVGVPWYGCDPAYKARECKGLLPGGAVEGPQGVPAAVSTAHTDHIVMGYRRDTAGELWPLDTSNDADCWWASQWGQTARAAMLYPGMTLLARNLSVRNDRSGGGGGGYGKVPRPPQVTITAFTKTRDTDEQTRKCAEAFCQASLAELLKVPPAQATCFRPHPFLVARKRPNSTCELRIRAVLEKGELAAAGRPRWGPPVKEDDCAHYRPGSMCSWNECGAGQACVWGKPRTRGEPSLCTSVAAAWPRPCQGARRSGYDQTCFGGVPLGGLPGHLQRRRGGGSAKPGVLRMGGRR